MKSLLDSFVFFQINIMSLLSHTICSDCRSKFSPPTIYYWLDYTHLHVDTFKCVIFSRIHCMCNIGIGDG